MSTSIQWTDEVWNPVVGCARVSPGCENCYAERVAHRGLTERHRGLTVVGKHGPRWTGEARFVPEALDKPLRWRKPRRVFVNSMSDLFHEDITFDQIAAVFGVMAATPRHTYQVLTKRPARMLEFFAWLDEETASGQWCGSRLDYVLASAAEHVAGERWDAALESTGLETTPPGWREAWPRLNVHIGVSIEDQRAADERIPLLLQCPAALRFLSVEPLLEEVDLRRDWLLGRILPGGAAIPAPRSASIDWVIVGGESGRGARACDIGWIRSVVAQAQAAGIAVFVKQLGACPVGTPVPGYTTGLPALRHRKGGDLDEWPEDLQVQEFPVVRNLAAVRGEGVADG